MATYIDFLPIYDIIHENIFPYLDYESRIQFNAFLPYMERKYNRISKQDILCHEIFVMTDRANTRLRVLTESTERRKRLETKVKMLSDFRVGQRGTVLTLCFPRFRQALVDKLNDIITPNSVSIYGATKHFKKKLRSLATVLLEEIYALPYTEVEELRGKVIALT